MEHIITFLALLLPIVTSGQIEKRTHYDSGEVKEIMVVDKGSNEIKSGKYQKYYPHGTVAETGSYVKNLKTGNWTYYYASGEIKARGNYGLDVKTGPWEYFDNKGRFRILISTETGGNSVAITGSASYPEDARENMIEGDVRVAVDIDSTCHLSNFRIVSSPNEIFNESVMTAGKALVELLPKEIQQTCKNETVEFTFRFRIE